MTVPEVVRDMENRVRPVKYGEDETRGLVVPATVDMWAGWLQDAYMRLVGELARISHDMDSLLPASCSEKSPSEEYLKEYAETYNCKYPVEEGDNDDWLDDAKWEMEYCGQCDYEWCCAVRLRRLVKELKEELPKG